MADNTTNEKDLIAQIDTLKQQAADLQNKYTGFNSKRMHLRKHQN